MTSELFCTPLFYNDIITSLYIHGSHLYNNNNYNILFDRLYDIMAICAQRFMSHISTILTSLNNVHCHFYRSSTKSVPVLAKLWNRHAWWNMCLAAKCLRDGGWRLENRICSGSSTANEDRTTVVVVKIQLHISVMIYRQNIRKM